jgi:hypothetical protein
MNDDARIAAVLDRAVTRLAAASATPPIEAVLGPASRLRRRRAATAVVAAAALTAAAVLGAVVIVDGTDRGGGTVAQAPALRTLPLSRGSARVVDAQSRLRHLPPPDAPPLGRVLASAATAKGDVVLLDVQATNGLRCVLEQYADANTPGGGGGRCTSGAEAPPYTGDGVELSAGQEMTPGGTNVSVVYGAAPTGTSRVELRGDGGMSVVVPAADAGAGYGHRTFFISAWPVPAPVTAVALAADGTKTGTSTERF